MQIADVIVGYAVVFQGVGAAVGIVDEVQRVGSISLSEQFAACVIVFMLHAVDGFAVTDSVYVIGIRDGISGAACTDQLSSIFPSKCPASSVVVAVGIAADRIAGDKPSDAVREITEVANSGAAAYPTGTDRSGSSVILLGLFGYHPHMLF